MISQHHARGIEFNFITASTEQMHLVALNQCVDDFEAGLVAGWEYNYSIHALSLEENGIVILSPSYLFANRISRTLHHPEMHPCQIFPNDAQSQQLGSRKNCYDGRQKGESLHTGAVEQISSKNERQNNSAESGAQKPHQI